MSGGSEKYCSIAKVLLFVALVLQTPAAILKKLPEKNLALDPVLHLSLFFQGPIVQENRYILRRGEKRERKRLKFLHV